MTALEFGAGRLFGRLESGGGGWLPGLLDCWVVGWFVATVHAGYILPRGVPGTIGPTAYDLHRNRRG